jgi:hypothetical protein
MQYPVPFYRASAKLRRPLMRAGGHETLRKEGSTSHRLHLLLFLSPSRCKGRDAIMGASESEVAQVRPRAPRVFDLTEAMHCLQSNVSTSRRLRARVYDKAGANLEVTIRRSLEGRSQ